MSKGFRCGLALCCVLALLLPACRAQAEFSPRHAALREERRLSLAVSARFDALSPLSDASLALVNEWLGKTEAILSIQGDSEGFALIQGEETLFSVGITRKADYTLTGFSPSDNAYLTRPQDKNALELIAGRASIPDFSALPAFYTALAPDLYALLGNVVSPKASKTATTIKNAAASASYENYTLTETQMNACWPEITALLLPRMREALAGQEAWYQAAEGLLSSLTFSGECRFKRFLDKNKGDMGLQFTGIARAGEDTRKITLFGGYTPGKGGYFSLSLPQIKGDDQTKIVLTGKVTAKEDTRTLSLEGSLNRTLKGSTGSLSMEGTLKNAIKNGTEGWSGKITLNTKIDGASAVWTFSPALSITDEGLQGEIALQKKEGKATKIKGSLRLRSADTQALLPAAETARDLRGLEENQARAVAAREMLPLSRLMYRLLAALPEESRALLTHDLRTESWMNGESVPVLPGSPKDQWILDEEDENCWIVEEDEE